MKAEVDELLKKPIILKKSSSIEKEREAKLKTILCMAIDGYDPDGEKNSATGRNRTSIKAAIERAGLSIDDNTIRKYLEEAKKLYPQARTKENTTRLVSQTDQNLGLLKTRPYPLQKQTPMFLSICTEMVVTGGNLKTQLLDRYCTSVACSAFLSEEPEPLMFKNDNQLSDCPL